MSIPRDSKHRTYALVRMRVAMARHVATLDMHNMDGAGQASQWARAWAKFAADTTFQRHRFALHSPLWDTLGQRNSIERKTYGEYRMSLAAERLILSTNPVAKQNAAKWIIAWAMIARN